MMITLRPAFLFLAIFCFFNYIFSPNAIAQLKDGLFQSFTIKIDTTEYTSEQKFIPFQNDRYLFFKTSNFQEIAEITIRTNPSVHIAHIQLLSGSDFTIVDTLVANTPGIYTGRIKFLDLENTNYVPLIFSIALKNGKYLNYQLKLMPYTETYVKAESESYELFLDEERILDLPCNNSSNIRFNGDWAENPDFDIAIAPGINSLRLKIKPKSLGSKTLVLNLKTVKPFLKDNQISYELPPVKIAFTVKTNRVDYLNTDRATIYFNPDMKSYDEIQLDYNKNLVMRKTYRIEDQQESGGNLIAEIFTVSPVHNNNKVLCRIRTFALHKPSSGYLYIKDGDKVRFITNFGIIEKPRIDEISLLREGEDWKNSLIVYPGEKIDLRIKGTGLMNSTFAFEGIDYVYRDTIMQNDEVAFFTLRIPFTVAKRKLSIALNKRITEYQLQVREYQMPTDLDFVTIDYGQAELPATSKEFDKPVFVSGLIKDINIRFDPNKIDEKGKLFGKQYLDIEIRVLNSKNDLIEIRNITNIVVCPGEKSVRSMYYDLKDCKSKTINLNDILVHKTYNMDAFQQIIITIKHNEQRHGATELQRTIKIIAKRKVNFDLQVSVPAGLLLRRFNESGYGNLTGISIAFLAQLSFYDGERLNRYKPYTIGGGFIAFDAFNLSANAPNRDLGIVILGTLLPVRRDTKLNFPLYFGGGYLLQRNTFFVMFGPGVWIRF